MRRREFITLVGSAAVWPVLARAQQPALPVVGFIRDGSADTSARFVAAFRKGLSETGYVEGQNVTVEYHYLEGQSDASPWRPISTFTSVIRRAHGSAVPTRTPMVCCDSTFRREPTCRHTRKPT